MDVYPITFIKCWNNLDKVSADSIPWNVMCLPFTARSVVVGYFIQIFFKRNVVGHRAWHQPTKRWCTCPGPIYIVPYSSTPAFIGKVPLLCILDNLDFIIGTLELVSGIFIIYMPGSLYGLTVQMWFCFRKLVFKINTCVNWDCKGFTHTQYCTVCM